MAQDVAKRRFRYLVALDAEVRATWTLDADGHYTTPLLPGFSVGRHCRLTKTIVDRACDIPDGLVVGEDAALDAARFERTDNGVVLITKQMLARL